MAWKTLSCGLNKFLYLYQTLQNITTDGITKWLLGIFTDFGYPTSVMPDNSPQFHGLFLDFCKHLDMRQVTSSHYSPDSNSLTESALKILKYLLTYEHTDNKTISEVLQAWRKSSCPNSMAPSGLFFGYHQCIPDGPRRLLLVHYINHFTKGLQCSTSKMVTFSKHGSPLPKLEKNSQVMLQDLSLIHI